MIKKSLLAHKPLHALLIGTLVLTLCMPGVAGAQRATLGTLPAGTTITVRTMEPISARDVDDRTYLGIVDQNVINSRGEYCNSERI